MNKIGSYKKLFLLYGMVFIFTIFFLRNILLKGVMFSNTDDGRLNMLILEHWYRVLRLGEPVSNLPIFYPEKGTIFYTDLLIGFAPIYIIARVIGADIYAAYKFTLVFLHFIGGFSFAYLLNHVLKYSVLGTLTGTVISMFSSAMAVSSHTQMMAIYFIPIIIIYFIKYIQNETKKRFTYGVLLTGIIACLAYTSFYIFYFLAIIVFVYFIVIGILEIKAKNKKYFLLCFQRKKEILCFAILEVLLLVPFIIGYGKVAIEYGGREWDEVFLMLPSFSDLFNVSAGNLIYGEMFSTEYYGLREYAWELYFGIPFGVWFLFLVSAIIIIKLYRKDSSKNKEIYALLGTSMIVCLLVLKWDHISLWYIIYKFLPAASAIRGVARIFMVLLIPIAIIVAHVITYMELKKEYNQIIFLVILLVVWSENIRKEGICAYWETGEIKAYIESVPVPPEDCKVFFISQGDSNHGRKEVIGLTDIFSNESADYQLDAWQIANQYNLVTINGYSGQAPIGWKLDNPRYDYYNEAVNRWLEINNLENIYVYDITTKTWSLWEN